MVYSFLSFSSKYWMALRKRVGVISSISMVKPSLM